MPKLEGLVRRLSPVVPGTQAAIEADLSRILVDNLKERKDGDQQRFEALIASISAIAKRVDDAARVVASGNDESISRFSAAVSAAFADMDRAMTDAVKASQASSEALRKDIIAAVKAAIGSIPAPVVNVDKPDLDGAVREIVSAMPRPDIQKTVRAEVDRAIKALQPEEKADKWVFHVEREDFSDKIKQITARRQ